MKHLIKKFIGLRKASSSEIEMLESIPVNDSLLKEIVHNNFDNYFAFVVTNSGYTYQTFKYYDKNLNKYFLLPEPNPVVVYFETARQYIEDIPNKKSYLFNELEMHDPDAGQVLQYAFACLQVLSLSGTFLFNALEAFANNLIPADYQYQKILESKTETYNKYQIQRNLLITEKLKNVIPEITGKSFHTSHGHKFELIKELKDLRDEIVHTKAFNIDSPNMYESLYNNCFNFNYIEAREAVKDYINFYEPNLIEECHCGREGD